MQTLISINCAKLTSVEILIPLLSTLGSHKDSNKTRHHKAKPQKTYHGDNMNLVNHSTKSQCAQILAMLKNGHSLTQIEALNYFGCFRLGARIYALKKEGHKIKTDMLEFAGKRFAVYSMKQLAKSKR